MVAYSPNVLSYTNATDTDSNTIPEYNGDKICLLNPE
jgi:hypothetical protein